ncbi:MAG: UDP-N-acetylmuramoyl-tripeptide--D-alanyl-D-alanine ligase [Firmicutes bacterium]|nr:UDP-N-acetylmuramoyl-tripeptide--D-alanyl-D-alanine ligase [Bacillota bacterium]
MERTSLAAIAQVIWAKPPAGEVAPHLLASGVSIDSRTVKPGDLFFALPGQRVDGHEYVESALKAGAVAAVVSRVPEGFDPGEKADSVLLEVKDVLTALQDLAAWNRQRYNIPVVGVTGSTGKTTTKDLISAVLSRRFKTLKTSGNYNNEIGLPLTLMQLDGTHQAAVIEMAMRGPGEIAYLCSIARPSIGLITNIGHTHEELLGSQENIARAKMEILTNLPTEGWAVLNWDDLWLRKLAARTRGSVMFYSASGQPGIGEYEGEKITASDFRFAGKEGVRFLVRLGGQEQEVYLPVPGEHNISNALGALAVGHLLGMRLEEMAEGLSEARLSAMRLDIKEGLNQTTIINDTYNANPDSMRAALRVLSHLAAGRRVAVLGEMYELGDYAPEGHKIVGVEAARQGVSLLVTVGDLAGYITEGARSVGLPRERTAHFDDNRSAADYLLRELVPGDTVLVKGSRGMKMEQIVAALTEPPNS